MSAPLEKHETDFYVGQLTELMMQLNGVLPDTPYDQVRQMCRKAAQLIQYLRGQLESENEDGA